MSDDTGMVDTKVCYRTMTPKSKQVCTDIYVKVYWVHKHLWTPEWIEKYHDMAPYLAQQIANRKVNMSNLKNDDINSRINTGADVNRFTCDDFALQILIEFAALNKLPVVIKTQDAVFMNIDPDYKVGNKDKPATPEGFALEVQRECSAHDMQRNTVHVPDEPTSADEPWTKGKLRPGDLVIHDGWDHVQVVTDVNPKVTPTEVTIMQGDEPTDNYSRLEKAKAVLNYEFGGPSYHEADREGSIYIGTAIEKGTYTKTHIKDPNDPGKQIEAWEYTNKARNEDDLKMWQHYKMNHQRWNFDQFNHIMERVDLEEQKQAKESPNQAAEGKKQDEINNSYKNQTVGYFWW